MKKILIVGGGGCEHAIAQAIVQAQPQTELLFCWDCAIPQLLPQARLAVGEPLQVALAEAVDLVIVAPEAPLVAGLVDELEAAGLTVFGPSWAAARLEGSQSFAKQFMQQYAVRTAAYRVFCEDEIEAALQYIEKLGPAGFPLVLKAGGLAAGKSLLICPEHKTALQGIRSLMQDKVSQEAGATVVIEQYLDGYEASVLAFCDGSSIRPMLAAQNHKKTFEGECGENTSGMGCIAPHPEFQQGSPLWQDFEQNILAPSLQGIQDRGWDFCGIISFGLMIQQGKCYLLKYNMRFGDPETQTILPLLQTPLLEIIRSCLMGRLAEQEILWKPSFSCTVVAAAENYPKEPVIGDRIEGLHPDDPNACGNLKDSNKLEGLYLAEACYKDGDFYSNGGRVLAWNATAAELETARRHAYSKLLAHPFRGIQFRRDIGGPPLVAKPDYHKVGLES